MTPTRPTELHQRRVRLTREPAAAAEARRQVRAVICAWNIPVDPDIAVLLTSDMVTNSIVRGDGKTITLAIRCSFGHLRIDVYDASRSLPTAVDGSAVTKTGSWLVLVAALSTEWGSFLTPAGQVVYFTLAFQSDVPSGGELAAAGDRHGDCEPWTRLAVPTSRTSWERHQPVTGVT
ncbi:MAG: hypothetical protein WBF34_26510 [Streptosporangiaceae bacterium]|jgi:hypothetical protein